MGLKCSKDKKHYSRHVESLNISWKFEDMLTYMLISSLLSYQKDGKGCLKPKACKRGILKDFIEISTESPLYYGFQKFEHGKWSTESTYANHLSPYIHLFRQFFKKLPLDP